MARDGEHVAPKGWPCNPWPWAVIADLLPSYDDRHTVPTGSLDSFLNAYPSPGLPDEEMDSETGHTTADQKDQALVPTT